MTETGGAPEPEGADAPTPSQGIPQQVPQQGPQQVPPQPPQGWQPPSPPPTPGAPASPGYGPAPGGLPPYQGYNQWNPHGLGKPGVIALRPLNVGDMFDGAITAMRRHAALIFGASAVIAVLITAVNLLFQIISYSNLSDVANSVESGTIATREQLQDQMFGFLGNALLLFLPALIITVLGRTLLTGFLTVVMGKAVLGRPAALKDTLNELKPRLLPLLGLTILYGLAIFGAALLCILPAVLPYVFWSLAGPALILERGTIRESFSRSRKLVSGSFWRVFGILLLAAVLASVLSGIISIPFSLGSGMFSNIFNPQAKPVIPGTGALLLQSVGSLIAETIVTPFTALVTVLLYVDQRMRREGMDIELARAAGMAPPAPPQQAW
jgi:hypothetical protein